MDQNELSGRLFAAAVGRAASRGLRLGPGADSDIRGFAASGATLVMARVAAEGEPRAPALIAEAHSAFETLVDTMAAAAAEIPNYQEFQRGVIGEQTLAIALSRLCPLFPIC